MIEQIVVESLPVVKELLNKHKVQINKKLGCLSSNILLILNNAQIIPMESNLTDIKVDLVKKLSELYKNQVNVVNQFLNVNTDLITKQGNNKVKQ